MIFYLLGLTFILVDIRIANIFIFPTGVQLGLCYNLAFIIILQDHLLPISVPLEIWQLLFYFGIFILNFGHLLLLIFCLTLMNAEPSWTWDSNSQKVVSFLLLRILNLWSLLNLLPLDVKTLDGAIALQLGIWIVVTEWHLIEILVGLVSSLFGFSWFTLLLLH